MRSWSPHLGRFWAAEPAYSGIVMEVCLGFNEDRTYVKCCVGDTRLLLSHVFRENEKVDGNLYKELHLGRPSINEGMFFENVIAQSLTASCYMAFLL